jgi:hypothetical protein
VRGWGAVFRNGVKLWNLRYGSRLRQYRIVWFRVSWIWAANHSALHESYLKGSSHKDTGSPQPETFGSLNSTKGEAWPYWQPGLRLIRYFPCVTTGGLDDP